MTARQFTRQDFHSNLSGKSMPRCMAISNDGNGPSFVLGKAKRALMPSAGNWARRGFDKGRTSEKKVCSSPSSRCPGCLTALRPALPEICLSTHRTNRPVFSKSGLSPGNHVPWRIYIPWSYRHQLFRQGTLCCSFPVTVHRAPHLLCCRALEVQEVRLRTLRLASAAPCKRLQFDRLR